MLAQHEGMPGIEGHSAPIESSEDSARTFLVVATDNQRTAFPNAWMPRSELASQSREWRTPGVHGLMVARSTISMTFTSLRNKESIRTNESAAMSVRTLFGSLTESSGAVGAMVSTPWHSVREVNGGQAAALRQLVSYTKRVTSTSAELSGFRCHPSSFLPYFSYPFRP